MTQDYFDNALKEKIWLKKLIEEYDQILRKYGIKGLKPANLRLSAGTTTLGTWSKNLRMISLSKKLLTHAPWETVIQVFKHEMAHQIADELLGGDDGHGHIFIDACKMIWVEPWARSAKVEIGYPSPDASLDSVCIEDKIRVQDNVHAPTLWNVSKNTIQPKLADDPRLENLSCDSSTSRYSNSLLIEKPPSEWDQLETKQDYRIKEALFWEKFNQRTTDQEGKKLRERLGKLLALSESSNAHEASIALAKAREMQQGLVLMSLDGYEDYETRIMRPRKRRLERHYSQIAAILSLHYNVRVIFSREFDTKELCDFQTMEILGQKHTAELAEYVYHFLLKALKSSYNWESKNRIVDRKSFYSGFLDGLSEKLKSTSKTTPEHLESNALVVKQNQLLDVYLDRRHPLTTTRRVQGRTVDGESFECGKEKGRRLDIRSPIKSTELKFLR